MQIAMLPGTHFVLTIENDCNESENITISQAGVPFFGLTITNIISDEHEGQVTDINVISDYNWAVSTGESWISVKPASGFRNGIFSVSITQPNLVESERIGSVSIVEETGLERVIDVIQYGSGPAVIIDGPSSLSFGYQAGGSKTFNVNSNTEWRIHNTSRNWFSVSQESAYGDASITVTTLQDNMDKTQTAKLKIVAKGMFDQELTVQQLGKVKSGSVNKQKLDIEFQDENFIKTYPNPFNDMLSFQIIAPISGKVKLDIFNILGEKVKNLYDNTMEEGETYNIKYFPAMNSSSILFYLLNIDGRKYSGTLVYKE